LKEENVKKNNLFIVIIFFLIVIFLLLFLYARKSATKGLIVKEYKVESSVLPTYFSGLKIVHFSDIYYDSTVNLSDIKHLVEKINVLKPDLIFFTGDLFKKNKKIKEEEINSITEIIGKLDAKLGKYAIKGDLDYNIETYNQIMESSGFKVLENSYELIYNEGLEPMFLCGLGSKLKESHDISKCYEYYAANENNENKAKYKIFLIHEGDSAVDVISTDPEVNLILGGNSLGGLVNIPYYGELFIPEGSQKYYSSHYKENNTEIYISSGLGTDEKRVRLFNKPSFNFYRLKSLQ
jgi:predicted MPP superfamily phosphohydrolase